MRTPLLAVATTAATLTIPGTVAANDIPGTDLDRTLTELAWERGEDCLAIPVDDGATRVDVGPGGYFVQARHVDDQPPIGSGTTRWGIMDCRPIVAPEGLTLVSPWSLVTDDPHAGVVLDSRAAFDAVRAETEAATPVGYLLRAEVEAS